MSRYLRTNDVITNDAGECIVLGINPSLDSVELFVTKTRTTEQYSLRMLRRELAAGTAKSSGKPTVAGTVRNASANSPAFKTFLFRKAVAKKIKAIVAQGKSAGAAIRQLHGTTLEIETGEMLPMCSEREAYRLLKLFENSESAAMPSYNTRGNRHPRYGERMIEIVLQLVESQYAVQHSKITVKKLTDLVNHSAHAEGVLDDGIEVSRKFVRSIITKQWNPDLDHNRLDPRVAKSAKAVAANRIRPGAPLNRVEMDTLHLPFIARTEYGIADDIYVMLAIDCETSLPLCWWLMLTKPTTEDTLQCLERAIYPKAELLNKMGINFDVDPYGAMLNLVWDNGSENSRHRTASITKVGINPQWTESNSGHQKPFIERLNRSLKEALEALPGCTRFNGVDGARTEAARKDLLMTVQQLEHWLARFLFEKWPHTPLERFVTAEYEVDEGLGMTPAERWRNYEARMPLPLCPPLEEWRALRYLETERSLSNKTGISFENYDFRGDNLKALIAQYGPNTTVKVHYNLFDYRTVYVPDKATGEWVVLVNSEVTDKTPAFPFVEAKKRRKLQKANYSENQIAKNFNHDLHEKILEKPSKKRSRTEVRKEAHALTRAQEAITRAEESPLPRPAGTSFTADSYIAEDAIPYFSTHHKPPRPAR